MRRTPGHSLAHNTGERRVFWLGRSCCTARAWSSFLPLLQAVSSICTTRNQLYGSFSSPRVWEQSASGILTPRPPLGPRPLHRVEERRVPLGLIPVLPQGLQAPHGGPQRRRIHFEQPRRWPELRPVAFGEVDVPDQMIFQVAKRLAVSCSLGASAIEVPPRPSVVRACTPVVASMPRPVRVCQLRQFAEAESPPPSCPQTIRIALSVQYTNPSITSKIRG